MTARARPLLAALMLLAVESASAYADATTSERVVISDGHVDMGPRFVNGAWTIEIRDDTVAPFVWRDPDNVVLQAVDAAQLPVPDDEAFAFLGKAGDPIWLLPQVQKPGVLWPGWNTQDPEVATTVRREVSWSLHGVRGPGTFVLFLNENFGEPETVFDSREPYPQETGIDANTHVHGNWAFSKPGTYLLDISMASLTQAGDEVSDRATVRLFVGDGNAMAAFDVPATPTPTPTQTPIPSASSAPRPTVDDGPVAGRVAWFGGGAVALLVVAGLVTVVAMRRRTAR